MSFIGKDQHPAPKMKDVTLTSGQKTNAYEQCIEVQFLPLEVSKKINFRNNFRKNLDHCFVTIC